MKLALALVAIILTGCATAPPPALLTSSTDLEFQTQNAYATKAVTVIPVDNISETCQGLSSLHQGKNFLGCAKYNNRACTIYVSRTTRLSILGHELRHCFEGHWHKWTHDNDDKIEKSGSTRSNWLLIGRTKMGMTTCLTGVESHLGMVSVKTPGEKNIKRLAPVGSLPIAKPPHCLH